MTISRARIARLTAQIRNSMPGRVWFLEYEDGETREAWDRRVAAARREAADVGATGRKTFVFTIAPKDIE